MVSFLDYNSRSKNMIIRFLKVSNWFSGKFGTSVNNITELDARSEQ